MGMLMPNLLIIVLCAWLLEKLRNNSWWTYLMGNLHLLNLLCQLSSSHKLCNNRLSLLLLNLNKTRLRINLHLRKLSPRPNPPLSQTNQKSLNRNYLPLLLLLLLLQKKQFPLRKSNNLKSLRFKHQWRNLNKRRMTKNLLVVVVIQILSLRRKDKLHLARKRNLSANWKCLRSNYRKPNLLKSVRR